jgi:hypothetical protein
MARPSTRGWVIQFRPGSTCRHGGPRCWRPRLTSTRLCPPDTPPADQSAARRRPHRRSAPHTSCPSPVGASARGLPCGSESIDPASAAASINLTAHPDAGTPRHGSSKAVQARRVRSLVNPARTAQTAHHGYRRLRNVATSKDPAVAALMPGPQSPRSNSPTSGSRGKPKIGR